MFVVGIMLMVVFFGARFFWSDIANGTVGLAIARGQCEDGTPANLCSENGMRCTFIKEKKECFNIAEDLECKTLPRGYYLAYDISCEVENA